MTKVLPISPGLHAVFLVVHFCLKQIFDPDAILGQSPIDPLPVNAEDRRKLGLTQPGTTLCYPTETGDVFLDMASDRATVWFTGGDWAAAALLLEETLKKTYQPHELVFEPVYPTAGHKTLSRQIVVGPTGSRRLASCHVTYGLPAAQDEDRMFYVRVFAQERKLAS